MPSGVEDTLQLLHLAAADAARPPAAAHSTQAAEGHLQTLHVAQNNQQALPTLPQQQQQQQQQPQQPLPWSGERGQPHYISQAGKQQQQQQQQFELDPEPPAALQNPGCLSSTFSWLEDEQSLLRCSAVCRLWHSVLEADDVWRRVYLRSLPEPLAFERVGSYRHQFRRVRALLDPPDIQPMPLKGVALCYNVVTGRLVSYNARQRVLSVMLADGSITSEVVVDAEGAAGSAHRPLLASTGSEMVVLAAADGALQLWDVSSCVSCGLLGRHGSFVTSLCGSGGLVASCCSREMRLWQVDSRSCLLSVPIGLPLPSPVLEPHVAVCHEQQLLALANCAAPAPCSVVKIYSTHPAHTRHTTTTSSSSSSETPTSAAAAAAGTVVGDSSCPGAVGALLLRELPVNAAADMKLQQGLLFVASCFHGRAVSNNSPFRSERPYTVVVNVWETRSWQLTRLISPRMWTDTPMFSMQGTPIISITQGLVLCATLKTGSTNAFPSCCVHALQLAPGIAKAGTTSGAAITMDTTTTTTTSRHAANIGSSGSSGRTGAQPEPSAIGTGAVAQGRVAVATAGGVGPVGLSASSTVMVAVSDQERQSWSGAVPLVEDTGGRLTALLTTPTQMVMATENGNIACCQLLTLQQAGLEQQQQQEEGAGEADCPGPATAATAAVAPPGSVVHVLQPHAAGSRFISLDL